MDFLQVFSLARTDCVADCWSWLLELIVGVDCWSWLWELIVAGNYWNHTVKVMLQKDKSYEWYSVAYLDYFIDCGVHFRSCLFNWNSFGRSNRNFRVMKPPCGLYYSLYLYSVCLTNSRIVICSNRTVLWLLNSSILERIPNMI